MITFSSRTDAFAMVVLVFMLLGVLLLEIHGFSIVVPKPTTLLNQGKEMHHPTKQHHQLLMAVASSDTMEPSSSSSTAAASSSTSETVSSSSSSSSSSSIVQRLQQELIDLGRRTERGFKATPSDRIRAVNLIFDLAQYNPTREPAYTYYGNTYDSSTNNKNNNSSVSLEGKWTLIYTDAPDITSLGTPSPFVTLGRIGQDCTNPPYVTNVIEWCSPLWMNNVPVPFLVGTNKQKDNQQQRVLQKVVTYGSAVPSSPTVVDLNVAGIQLATSPSSSSNDDGVHDDEANNLRDQIEKDGIVVGLLKQQRKRTSGTDGRDNNNIDLIKLDESQQPPFGSFEILYLNDTFRITKTNRNHYAVNVRIIPGKDEEWF